MRNYVRIRDKSHTNIYQIRQPDGEIRYVGKTGHPIEERLRQHIDNSQNSKQRRKHLYVLLRKIIREGGKPTIELLERVEGNGCKEEIRWIAEYKTKGVRLVNHTNGGEGRAGYKASPETLAKMRKAQSNRSPEWRANLSESLKGQKFTPERLKRLSEAHKGIKYSEESKLKKSKAMKQYWASNPEAFTQSQETKLKRAEAMRKYWAKQRASA